MYVFVTITIEEEMNERECILGINTGVRIERGGGVI